jgi:uncharacterized protein YfiM (DUF2279 family)
MSTSRISGFLKPALLTLSLLITLVLLLTLLAVQWHPAVPRSVAVDAIAINTIEDLIVDNAPARVGRAGELQLQLDQSELNLIAAFALQTIPRLSQVAANVSIVQKRALLDISIPLPLRQAFLNMQIEIRAESGSAELGTLWIGNLPVPGPAMRLLVSLSERWLANSYVNYGALRQLKESVYDIAFEGNSVSLALNWEPQLIARVQNQAEQLLLSAADNARIDHYSMLLKQILDKMPDATRSVSLHDLLSPLFVQAQLSVAQGTDAIVENRALLQAVSRYVNEPAIDATDDGRRFTITLQRRTDLAQHFTSSAAMTASVGADIAGLLATSKEAHDARYRSGFSFSDLTANMAGVAFGSAATESASSARRLQASLGQATAETDYMPPVTRDNAGLSEEDFLQQYQDRTSPAYRERLNAIDAQLAALPIYKTP